MSELSLITIMRDDPEFGKRITKKVQEIKQDKEHLTAIANDYSKKYEQEIKEGTELRNRLLTEGSQKGLTEEQIMGSLGRFVPTVRTPILNLLHFMLRESEDDRHYGKRHYERRDQMNEALIKNGHAAITETYNNPNLNELSEAEAERILDEFVDDTFAPRTNPARKMVNNAFNDPSQRNDERAELKEPEKMEEFLYGNLTLEQFDVLKKLKALAQSENISEATLAFKKCRELCAKYDLDFDKIPCTYKKSGQ
jgi:hypothetical protein